MTDYLKLLSPVLEYSPESGLLKWKISPSAKVKIGQEAISKDNRGYVIVTYKGKTYKAHRVAWLFVYGKWPESAIDHINGKKDDNRIENLRLTNAVLNGQNRMPTKTRATLMGAYLDKSRTNFSKPWRSSITVNKSKIYLGSFSTEQEAHTSYKKAKAIHHIKGAINE
jgi:hypothetical protein